MLKNIIANIVGRFWSIFSSYLFIPIYISLLGIENYSVISFSIVLIGIVSIVDAGLTATLSREFARKADTLDDKHRILNTLETCYWGIAIFLIIIILTMSQPIADKWITLKNLNKIYVGNALKIFGIGAAFQLLGDFYLGGLIGLEKQVKANTYQIAWGIFRNGAVLIVIFFHRSLIYFFAWQTLVTISYVILLRVMLVKQIHNIFPRKSNKIDFDRALLRKMRGFAGGMLLISVVAAINTQLDKIAISKLLPIAELGFYSIAVTLAQVLPVLVTPVSTALLPRFTGLYSAGKHQDANKLFSNVFTIISLIVFSVAANVMFNSHDLILIWTGNHLLADSASRYVPYTVFGSAMLAMQIIPFNIAIANGYTKINNILGIASLAISIPGYWLSVYYFGPVGAALTWCFIQSITTPVYLFFIRKKFLAEYKYSVLIWGQIIKPAAGALTAAFLLTFALPHIANRSFLQLILIGCCTLVTFIFVTLIGIPVDKIRWYLLMAKNKLPTAGIKKDIQN